MAAEHKVVLDEWKKAEEERKQWNANRRQEWKVEVEAWNVLKGKGKGKKPLLGERKATPRPTRPSADTVEDSEVSLVILYGDRACSNRDVAERLGFGKCDISSVTLFRWLVIGAAQPHLWVRSTGQKTYNCSVLLKGYRATMYYYSYRLFSQFGMELR